MNKSSSRNLLGLPLKPVAACLALVFGMTETSHAATLMVTKCTDDGSTGTLRNTVASAVSGDTVQVPGTCDDGIGLTQGPISITGKSSLTITGDGVYYLAIDATPHSTTNEHERVFQQMTPGGSLTLSGMSVFSGSYVGGTSPYGGCIYSAGDLTLENVAVKFCQLYSSNLVPKGGGIFAKGTVDLVNSVVSSNTANSASTTLGGGVYAKAGLTTSDSVISGNYVGGNVDAKGGGVYANGTVTMSDSSISNNTAVGFTNDDGSRGGGIFLAGGGDVSIEYSTIAGNIAGINSALQINSTRSGSYSVSIKNSTISGNSATYFKSASTYWPTTISNSTIAFNKANLASASVPVGFYSNQEIIAQSSIFANNIAASNGEYDVAALGGITGANNLIVRTPDTAPLGTITACPLLGPLTNNGGPTATVALLDGSPAINAGNNTLNLSDDQRGTGFKRVVGSSADIGAYELQSGVTPDRIFSGEFEGRCD